MPHQSHQGTWHADQSCRAELRLCLRTPEFPIQDFGLVPVRGCTVSPQILVFKS